MIDFRKELAKFDFVTSDTEFKRYDNEMAQAIDVFTAAFRRLGKELNNTNIQLEEVLLYQLAENEKNEYMAEQSKKIAACEEEKLSLVRGLVATLDQLEDIYRYSLQNKCGSWSGQMQALWSNATAGMLMLGITRIEGENTYFDARIHAAVQVKEDGNRQNGIILEVLRSGYLYQSHLLRKAQVMVNKNEGCLQQ